MAEPSGTRHIVFGTCDPWIAARIAALRHLVPLADIRLQWGYLNAAAAAEISGDGQPLHISLPPRSLGRLRWLFRRVVRERIRGGVGGTPETLWIVLPVQWPVAEAFPEALVVYVVADDYRFYGWPAEVVRRYEAALLRRAALVVAVSNALAEELVRRGADAAKILVSPNGLPASWIPREPPSGPSSFPPDLGPQRRPVAGVIGRISRRLRLDWIETVARRLPEVHWLFVGPLDDHPNVREWRARMAELPNCRFVGPRPYDDLARIHAALDVSVLPYNGSGLNPTASPVRLYCSLPFPAPIVATPGCRQIEEFARYIHLCGSLDEFVEAIMHFARGRSDPSWPERHGVARFHTWEARARDVVLAAAERGIVALDSSRVPDVAA